MSENSSRRAHVFDAYGTLFDVHAPVMRRAREIGPDATRLAEIWRSKQLEYAWVLSLIGAYEDFDHLTEKALDAAIAVVGGVPPGTRARLLEAYLAVELFPDVLPSLEALRSAGDLVLVLSNANASMIDVALSATGIARLVHAALSVEAVKRFKPDRAAYALLDPWRAENRRLTFYSSNRWDVAGARASGIEAIWVNRRGAPDEYKSYAPSAVMSSLSEVIAEQTSATPSNP